MRNPLEALENLPTQRTYEREREMCMDVFICFMYNISEYSLNMHTYIVIYIHNI